MTSKPTFEHMGSRLAQARVAAGLTQTAAAQRLGIDRAQTIGDIEAGKCGVSVARLAQLCKLYGVSSDFVLGLAQSPSISGIGGIINLAVERAILGASSLREVADQSRKLGATLGDHVLFGYEVPSEYEVLAPAEWEPRRLALRLKLERLQQHDAQRGTSRRPPRNG